MQNIKVNRKIYKMLGKREKQLTPIPVQMLTTKQQMSMGQICPIQKNYVEYIRLYIQVANKTSILSKAMSKLPEEIIQTSSTSLLKNCHMFRQLNEDIMK